MQYERGWRGVLSARGTDGLRKKMSLQYRDGLLILPGILFERALGWVSSKGSGHAQAAETEGSRCRG